MKYNAREKFFLSHLIDIERPICLQIHLLAFWLSLTFGMLFIVKRCHSLFHLLLLLFFIKFIFVLYLYIYVCISFSFVCAAWRGSVETPFRSVIYHLKCYFNPLTQDIFCCNFIYFPCKNSSSTDGTVH